MIAGIYYFGCWDGTGHHLWTSDGRFAPHTLRLPWTGLDGTLCGDPALADMRGRSSREPLYWPGDDAHQPQGVARLHHRDGWTALAWWDRSEDRRYGSNSAFVAEGTLTAAEIVERGAGAFPSVWRRIEGAGGLRLPGVAVATG